MHLELGLIFLGFIGLLMRRNLIAIGFCFQLVFLGIVLWLHRLSAHAVAEILSLIFGLYLMLYTVVLVFVWRHLGTLHIDEIRSLRR